jgi:hypothetical protein
MTDWWHTKPMITYFPTVGCEFAAWIESPLIRPCWELQSVDHRGVHTWTIDWAKAFEPDIIGSLSTGEAATLRLAAALDGHATTNLHNDLAAIDGSLRDIFVSLFRRKVSGMAR